MTSAQARFWRASSASDLSKGKCYTNGGQPMKNRRKRNVFRGSPRQIVIAFGVALPGRFRAVFTNSVRRALISGGNRNRPLDLPLSSLQ
jgi:hypothetical protein